MEENDKTVQQQEARAMLRESYLKAVRELIGKPCSVLTYEQTSLKATFVGWNPDNSAILVRDLETPSCVKMNAALLRTPDILAIKFDEPILLP